jgi:hypothetical protein
MIISSKYTFDKHQPFVKFREYLDLFKKEFPGTVKEKILTEGFKKDKTISKHMTTGVKMVCLTIKKKHDGRMILDGKSIFEESKPAKKPKKKTAAAEEEDNSPE